MRTSKETRFEQLKTVFTKIHETSNGNWISVKSNPLSEIYINAGLDHNWGSTISQVLKTNGFFETEGNAGGMRYKTKSQIIPDYSSLANQALYLKNGKTVEETETPKKDLTPPRFNEVQLYPKVEKTIKESRRDHIDIDMHCYTLYNGGIIEVEVMAVNKLSGEYLHVIKGLNFQKEGVPNNQLFESPEQLVSCLLHGVTKYPKPEKESKKSKQIK